MERRDFIKNISLLAIGGMLGYFAHDSRDVKSGITALKSGETIEHRVTRIRMKGWRLLLKMKDVENYAKEHPSQIIEFELLNGNEDYGNRLILAGNSKENRRHLVVLTDNELYYQFLAFPRGRQPYLIIKEGEGRTFNLKTYPVQFEFYSYKPKNPAEETRVYSEIPLEERVLKEIHEISLLFDEFSNTRPIYIYRFQGDEARQGMHLQSKYNLVHSNYFTPPRLEIDGIATVFHELSHGIMSGSVLFSRDQKPNNKLMQAYDLLGKARDAYRNKKLHRDPFEIFTESSYLSTIAGKEMTGGHPWDNHNELFASALTIFRFFPDEFIQRYASLSSTEKDFTKGVCNAIFNILESINPETKALQKLLPKYEKLKQLFMVYPRRN